MELPGVSIFAVRQLISTTLYAGIPACPWRSGRHGCMVALVTDAITNKARAIHRTAITPKGEKIGRMSLGPIAGCVVRLWPDETVTTGLVIGEGVETVLAAATMIEHRGMLLQPAWQPGSAGLMSTFPPIAGVEELTVLVDNDETGTGARAALECSRRWTEAGRQVIRLVPDRIGDFNNIAKQQVLG
jgi:putative DNA primase/helicase